MSPLRRSVILNAARDPISTKAVWTVRSVSNSRNRPKIDPVYDNLIGPTIFSVIEMSY